MPQPRDITGAIYKRKKFQSRKLRQRMPVPEAAPQVPAHRLRRIRFSTFSFAMGLLITIAVIGQFALMSLFSWI